MRGILKAANLSSNSLTGFEFSQSPFLRPRKLYGLPEEAVTSSPMPLPQLPPLPCMRNEIHCYGRSIRVFLAVSVFYGSASVKYRAVSMDLATFPVFYRWMSVFYGCILVVARALRCPVYVYRRACLSHRCKACPNNRRSEDSHSIFCECIFFSRLRVGIFSLCYFAARHRYTPHDLDLSVARDIYEPIRCFLSVEKLMLFIKAFLILIIFLINGD